MLHELASCTDGPHVVVDDTCCASDMSRVGANVRARAKRDVPFRVREQAQEVRKIFLGRVPPEREREASLREKSCLGVDGGSRWPSGGGNAGGD